MVIILKIKLGEFRNYSALALNVKYRLPKGTIRKRQVSSPEGDDTLAPTSS